MNNKNFKSASYLASPIFMGISLILCFLCAYFGMSLLSGYLCFMFLLSTTAFVWGRFSEYGIEADIKAKSHYVYLGQEITMEFTLQNNKCLPLVWLEWIQDHPKCLEVPDDFEVLDITNPQATTIIDPVLCKRFSFIRWYETIAWTSTFLAVRRGVYLPQMIQIHTGDGFGLSLRKKQCNLANPSIFVVYPKRVPVSTDIFFKNAWSASTGPHGVIEDVTVLRGTREYLPNDPFKRINWRLAARGEELSVNLYDTIAPRTVYFFVDTATFCDVSPDNEAFEDTLSVVASLIEELYALDMRVGLYLPVSSEDAGHHAHATTRLDCLLALAKADCGDASVHFRQENIANLAATMSGAIYYVCFDGSSCNGEQVFADAGISQFSIIAHEVSEKQVDLEHRVHMISDFKRV